MTTTGSAKDRRPIFIAQGTVAVLTLIASIIGLAAGGASDAAALTDSFESLRDQPFRFVVTQDFEGANADTRQRPPGAEFTFEMKGAYDPSSGLTKLSTTFGGFGFNATCTYISDDDTAFASVHKSRQADLQAKWLRTSVSKLGASQAFDFSESFEKLQLNAKSFVSDLEEAGKTTIRGVETTRYEGTIDVKSFFDAVDFSTAAFPEQLPFEAYLGDDGFPRRITMTFATTGREVVRFVTTQDFYDIGETITVKRPAEADVRDGTGAEITTACFPKSAVPAFPTGGD